jgi:hypothetical protein
MNITNIIFLINLICVIVVQIIRANPPTCSDELCTKTMIYPSGECGCIEWVNCRTDGGDFDGAKIYVKK